MLCEEYFVPVYVSLFFVFCPGWQPGMQQGAADWDEVWDKLEDEGAV